MITSKKVVKSVLDNGLTILIFPNHNIPKVSTQLWYNVGSKDEKSGEKGIAHLIEHMIFKGTKRLSESDINLITAKLSGYCNAFTSYDYTGYLFDFPTQYWHESLEIMSDCMRNCTFKSDLLSSELKAVVQELKMYRDYYSSSLIEKLISSIFSDHPYNHPIIGHKQDLWQLERESLVNFYNKHYIPNNATLVIVGDVETSQAVEITQQYFGHINSDPRYKKEEFYHNIDLNSISVNLYRDIVQPIAIASYIIPGAQAKLDYVTDVLSWVIGTGKGSRLYKKLVDQLQLVTDIEAFTYDLFDFGLFCIYFTPKQSQDLDKIFDIISQELAVLSFESVSEKELIRATKKARVDYLSLLESNQKQASIIGKSYLATGDENYLFKYLEYPLQSLPEIIQNFAKQYLRPSLINKGCVVPLPEGEQKYWLMLQEQSDEQDMKILSTKVRESIVEDGLYVKKISTKEPPQFSFPRAKNIKLENGLDIYYHHNDNVEKVELVLEFKANHRYDPDDKLGLSGFVCEMLTEGTKNYSASELTDVLESHGMAFNASPGIITMSMLSDDLEHGLTLLKEIISNAIFDPETIDKVRERIIADIKNYWDNPSQFAEQIVCEQIYKGSPMCKGSLGTLEGIANITRDDLINFYKKYFTPQKSILALVGNIEKYNIDHLLKKTLGNWSGSDVEELKYPTLPPVKEKTIDYQINRDQVVLCFAGKSVSRLDKNFDKLLIFDQIFTGGVLGTMSSRLFQLREQSGLFYTISGSLLAHSGRQPGMVFIKTIVSCDRLKESQDLITQAIVNVSKSISDEEFEQARNAIINSLIDFFESNRQIALAFIFLAHYNLPQDFFDKRGQQILSIEKEDVRKIAAEILRKELLVTVRIGRIK